MKRGNLCAIYVYLFIAEVAETKQLEWFKNKNLRNVTNIENFLSSSREKISVFPAKLQVVDVKIIKFRPFPVKTIVKLVQIQTTSCRSFHLEIHENCAQFAASFRPKPDA
jgi:hypothetical protein